MPFGILFASTAALIWATSSLMVKAQAARVDTLSFNAFRVGVGALFFYLLLPFFGGSQLLAQLTPPIMLTLGVSVILGFCIGDSLYFWSMTKIGASRAMPISGIYPVFTWLLAVPLLNERVTVSAVAGTVLVIAALFLLSREKPADADEANDMLLAPSAGIVPREISPRTRYFAIGGAVFAAFVWACSTTLLRLGIQMQAPVTLYDNVQQTVLISAFRLTVAALLLAPVTQWLKGARVWASYRGAALPRQIALALYSTGIGSLFFVLGVALAGAARAALLNSASPLLGVIFSWLFLKEKMTRRVWAGTALAITGVWLVLL
ncbi:MAG: DMT family transporter [Chloroflexi bacterium]|nr:DMT family transporter [Chloroflexota bacterium]